MQRCQKLLSIPERENTNVELNPVLLYELQLLQALLFTLHPSPDTQPRIQIGSFKGSFGIAALLPGCSVCVSAFFNYGSREAGNCLQALMVQGSCLLTPKQPLLLQWSNSRAPKAWAGVVLAASPWSPRHSLLIWTGVGTDFHHITKAVQHHLHRSNHFCSFTDHFNQSSNPLLLPLLSDGPPRPAIKTTPKGLRALKPERKH